MVTVLRAALMGVAWALIVLAAAQAEDIKVGNRYREFAELSKGLGGIVLPLPESEWQVVTLNDSRITSVDYNIPIKTGGFLSLPLDKSKQQIKSFISYWIASTDSMHGGWKEPDVCSSADSYYTYKSKDNRRLTRVQCWSIKLHSVRAAQQLPPLMIGVTYFWSAGAKALHVTYFFNPETAGFAPLDATSWSKKGIGGDPKRAKYIDDLKTWAVGWQPKIDQGFAGKNP